MLRKTNLIFILINFFVISCASTFKIEPPELIPIPSTERQNELINEGVKLHDQGNYDGAINKYQEVLKENPDNVVALYELSSSYSAKGNYRKSLEICKNGIKYKSKHLREFYIMMGNNFDHLKDPDKSIQVYKKAIELFSDYYFIYYNLGVTYYGVGKLDEARNSFKKAVKLNPNHSSSHFALGEIFYQENYKIPSLLALCRFLVLEPKAKRSNKAFSRIQEILQRGVKVEDLDKKNITVMIDENPKTDEGDFGAVDLGLVSIRALRYSDEYTGKSEIELITHEFNEFFSVMSEIDSTNKGIGFVWNYYVPYFIEMKRKNYIEPFCYYIYQTSNVKGIQEWLDKNSAKADEFLSWSKDYKWSE
jgi:Tfp pilus assembly protein PilF